MASLNNVKGLREAKAAFQRLPEVFRQELLEATERALKDITSLARAKVILSPSLRTRTLLNSIGYTLNKKSGRGKVGVSAVSTLIPNPNGGRQIRIKGNLIAGKGGSALTSQGAKLVRPSRYAHLVEFGSRHMTAEPFMVPAAEQGQAGYLAACVDAGARAEQALKVR